MQIYGDMCISDAYLGIKMNKVSGHKYHDNLK